VSLGICRDVATEQVMAPLNESRLPCWKSLHGMMRAKMDYGYPAFVLGLIRRRNPRNWSCSTVRLMPNSCFKPTRLSAWCERCSASCVLRQTDRFDT